MKAARSPLRNTARRTVLEIVQQLTYIGDTVWTPPKERKAVEQLNAKELHDELVEDALQHFATPLERAVAAYIRIGKLTGRGPEAAFREVLEEKKARTGNEVMPLG